MCVLPNFSIRARCPSLGSLAVRDKCVRVERLMSRFTMKMHHKIEQYAAMRDTELAEVHMRDPVLGVSLIEKSKHNKRGNRVHTLTERVTSSTTKDGKPLPGSLTKRWKRQGERTDNASDPRPVATPTIPQTREESGPKRWIRDQVCQAMHTTW